jgi:hypothetical protein
VDYSISFGFLKNGGTEIVFERHPQGVKEQDIHSATVPDTEHTGQFRVLALSTERKPLGQIRFFVGDSRVEVDSSLVVSARLELTMPGGERQVVILAPHERWAYDTAARRPINEGP